MPDYGEAAEKTGWKQVGSKWVHPDHPTEYNAGEIWRKYQEVRTRPLSIDAPDSTQEPYKAIDIHPEPKKAKKV